jgi:hypothetical protein
VVIPWGFRRGNAMDDQAVATLKNLGWSEERIAEARKSKREKEGTALYGTGAHKADTASSPARPIGVSSIMIGVFLGNILTVILIALIYGVLHSW